MHVKRATHIPLIPKPACVLATLLLLGATPARAIDTIAVEVGHGNDSSHMQRLHVTWQTDLRWVDTPQWRLTGYLEATVGHWHGHGVGAEEIWEIGVTPVFRLQPGGRSKGVYFEGAIGAHFLNQTRINAGRVFGLSFNFGDHLGFGTTFGRRGEYDLGYRFQHLSNGGIKNPNDGINFHQFRLAYKL